MDEAAVRGPIRSARLRIKATVVLHRKMARSP
jgi:hypothetical protein